MIADSFKNDLSEDEVGGIPKTFSYDAEENCLISDSGIDSEHGRIHFPLTWSKAGIVADQVGTSSGARDIVVSRPFRSQSGHDNTRVDQMRWGKEAADLGSESGYSTGNKDRDAVMARAKAILNAHNRSPDDETRRNDTSMESLGLQSLDTETSDRKKDLDQDLAEDGIAPLGGSWPMPAVQPSSINEMINDPMNNLQTIYHHAAVYLQVSSLVAW